MSKVLSITRTTTCGMELGMKQEIPLKSTCCRIEDVFSTFDVYEGYASLTCEQLKCGILKHESSFAVAK